MKLNFESVLRAIELGGAAMPAFEALFKLVLPLFTGAEQEELKTVYAQARAESDAAYAALRKAIDEDKA